jgi:hypothetical protein
LNFPLDDIHPFKIMATNDVKTLFRRFGGNASVYQEIVSRDQVIQAEEKWPMLGQIKPTTPHEAPSARRAGGAPNVRRLQGDEPPSHLAPHPDTNVQEVEVSPRSRGVDPAARLGGVFQSMLPNAGVPTGPAERVSQQREVAAQAPLSSNNELFASFLSRPNSVAHRSTKPLAAAASLAAATPLMRSSLSAASALAHKSGGQDSGIDSVLGRKLGMQSTTGAAHAHAPVPHHALAPPLSASAGLKNKAVQQKSNELQQFFGKLVAEPETSANNVKPEGRTAKRPTKW